MRKINVLCACEESQSTMFEFLQRGFNAFSCDLKPCSGGRPDRHISGDVTSIMPEDNHNIHFITDDLVSHYVDRWDIIIAHPPCTYLTRSQANRIFNIDHSIKDLERYYKAVSASKFFYFFYEYDCDFICIENPVPIKEFISVPYSQIVQPYEFGHPYTKKTCLWLKGLRPLICTDIVVPSLGSYGFHSLPCGNAKRSEYRSKSFKGISIAAAEQWGEQVRSELLT